MSETILSPHLTYPIRNRFIGREEALNVFYSRPAYRSMANGVYYVGDGGTGKTWLLRKIIADNQDEPGLEVSNIIDFYDTTNNTLHGLQDTIQNRLKVEGKDFFERYRTMVARLRKGRDIKLEDKVNYTFIECCQEAVANREVVLLLDTFERVQNRYVGAWLLEKFLPQVRGLIIVLAGRPEKAEVPKNIVTFELSGFNEQEAEKYIRMQSSISSPDIIRTIWQRTEGLPLLIELVLDLVSPMREQFLSKLSELPPGELIKHRDDLKRMLVGQFAAPVNNYNRIIWAMSHLWRRFDLPMLKYLVEYSSWFQPGDYDRLVQDLRRSVYIKETQAQESHLLHDEIRKMVAHYILDEAADPVRTLRDELNQCIVRGYYNQEIEKAGKQENENEANQLRAEQIGYILESDKVEGLALYKREMENKDIDVDYEELLWGEIREHTNTLADKGLEIYQMRGARLRQRSLFQRAENHYRDMIDHFPEEYGQFSLSLAYMIYQQGRLEDASKEYAKIIEYAHINPGIIDIARLENNLGQLERASGRWELASEHFNRGASEAIRNQDQEALIDIYINRSYLYSLRGKYEEALNQCKSALTSLEAFSMGEYKTVNFKPLRLVYVTRNLGLVHRHKGDYATSLEYYRNSLKIAKSLGDETAISDCLQHLGITLHLLGRQYRREGVNLSQALDYQLQAFEALNSAIEMAKRAEWRSAIANGLNRIAKIYREVNYFHENVKYFANSPLRVPLDKEACVKLTKLHKMLASFDNPFELEYLDGLLIKNRLFADLEAMEKSERLFEVSSIIADEVSDHYRALDSMTEAARLLMWMKLFEEAKIVIRRIRRLPGFEGQQEVFAAIASMTQAHLDFAQKNYGQALELFVGSFNQLANCTGYASYLLTDRLRDLEWRLREMPRDQALLWCDTLEYRWGQTRALEQRPDMLDMLERIRLERYRLLSS